MPSYIPTLITLARSAGAVIMEYYEKGAGVSYKEDNSPVTAADIAANDIIVAGLKALAPDIPIVSEESTLPSEEEIENTEQFWLVDPLDGTKSYIKQTGEFTVNIALIKDTTPILGVIYVPAQDLLYYTGEDGKAYKQTSGNDPEQIHVRPIPEQGLTVVASRSHRTAETDTFIETLHVADFTSVSSSLKFCLVAEGTADIYPRFGPTMEWDTAAGHAIVLSAGGTVVTPEGTPFTYAKPTFLNGAFIARTA